jgi:hypothetical protein
VTDDKKVPDTVFGSLKPTLKCRDEDIRREVVKATETSSKSTREKNWTLALKFKTGEQNQAVVYENNFGYTKDKGATAIQALSCRCGGNSRDSPREGF